MVVTERLTQVANQLAKVTPDQKTDESALEDELLNGDPATDTPAHRSKVPSPEVPSTPTEPAEKDDNHNEAIAKAGGGDVDSVADRVNHIFGSKRRAIETAGSDASPKVANIIVTEKTSDDKSADVTMDETPSEKTIAPPETPSTQSAPPGDQDMDVSDGEEEENAGEDDEEEAPAEGDGDGEWADRDDVPEEFPDVGFPMQVPGYPMQPIFDYRYRARNSTPRSRRIDFTNSIVLRKCDRDRHTGRIAQEEYEAREDSEMALSLGYVLYLCYSLWFMNYSVKKNEFHGNIAIIHKKWFSRFFDIVAI